MMNDFMGIATATVFGAVSKEFTIPF